MRLLVGAVLASLVLFVWVSLPGEVPVKEDPEKAEKELMEKYPRSLTRNDRPATVRPRLKKRPNGGSFVEMFTPLL